MWSIRFLPIHGLPCARETDLDKHTERETEREREGGGREGGRERGGRQRTVKRVTEPFLLKHIIFCCLKKHQYH